MIPEFNSRAADLFAASLELPEQDVAAFLARECGSDAKLYAEIEALRTEDRRAGSLLRNPLFSCRPEVLPGDQLGRYRIVSRIGSGGMGTVYKAMDTRLGRDVAIKVLFETPLSGFNDADRLEGEARAAAALNHPNIVTIHDVCESDNRTYIVMEYLTGKPLSDAIPSEGLKRVDAVRYARAIGDALQAAHRAGIVHRDIKPANVIVGADDVLTVVDFGIARVADAASTAAASDSMAAEGTHPYVSPEQLRGKPADVRSDVYSFGILLHELLAGTPYLGELRRLPPSFGDVVTGCVRQDPDQRFQSMDEVLAALARAVRLSSERHQQNVYMVALLLLMVLVMPGLLGFETLVGRWGAEPWEREAEVRRQAAIKASARADEAYKDGQRLFQAAKYADAVGFLKLATDSMAADSRARLALLAEALFRLGEYREAAKTYSGAIGRLDQAEYRLGRGKSMARLGHLDAAVEDFATAIRLNGYLADAYAERGLISLRKQEKQQARTALAKAIELERVVERDQLLGRYSGPAISPGYVSCSKAALALLDGHPDEASDQQSRCEAEDIGLSRAFRDALGKAWPQTAHPSI